VLGHGVVLGVVAAAQGVDFRRTAGDGVENILLECSDFVLSRLLYKKEGEGKENSLKFECRRIHVKVDTGIDSEGLKASEEILEEAIDNDWEESKENVTV